MTVSIEQRLRDAAASLSADRVTVEALAQAHGPAAPGTLLLLLTAPCLLPLPLPGVGTAFGLGMAALAFAMWRGRAGHCLPRRVADFELPLPWARRVLELLARTYGLAGRFARARLEPLVAVGERRWIAATIGLMAFIVVLPIPFGNVLPALALMLLGTGLVFRDGLAVLAGLVAAGFAVLGTGGLVALAWTLGADGVSALLSV